MSEKFQGCNLLDSNQSNNIVASYKVFERYSIEFEQVMCTEVIMASLIWYVAILAPVIYNDLSAWIQFGINVSVLHKQGRHNHQGLQQRFNNRTIKMTLLILWLKRYSYQYYQQVQAVATINKFGRKWII